MRPTSTARLMVLFTAVAVVTSLAGSFARFAMFAGLRGPAASVQLHSLAIYTLTLLAVGWFQSRIIARHRKPLRRWTLATGLGALAGSALGTLTSREILSVAGPLAQGKLALWLQMLSWAVTGAACIGTAQALVIWGRQWTSDTLQWLMGLLVLRVLAGALPHLFREAAEPGTSMPLLSYFVLPLLSAALVGAGTAWLLDRIVFKVPAGQPFEAGGRTVE